MRLRIHFLVPALLLAACATPPPDGPPDQLSNAAQCNADAAKRFIGQTGTPALAEDARKAAGADAVRMLRPNDVATMDYRSDRLNVLLDDAGKVHMLRCG